MQNKNFGAIILSHGRAHKVYTYKMLRKYGYTGRIIILIDDEDQEAETYREIYGDQVWVFNKSETAAATETGDNNPKRNTVLFARNAVFDIAKSAGLTHFIMLDDDYTVINYKFDSDLVYTEKPVKNLDSLFDLFLKYFDSINVKSIAFAQNGDFIGGKKGSFGRILKLRRKCMNTFICATARPFKFIARMNDDVTTYVVLGQRGDLFLTVNNVAVMQKPTQANAGGLTEMYLEAGTYVKSFYTVMFAPSCTKIAEMGDKHRRLHHKIRWNNAVPVIVDESLKK